jgi:hypothetical protein
MLIKLFKLLLYLFSDINSSSPKIMSFFAAVLLRRQSLPTCVVYWVCTVKIRRRGQSKILVKKTTRRLFSTGQSAACSSGESALQVIID